MTTKDTALPSRTIPLPENVVVDYPGIPNIRQMHSNDIDAIRRLTTELVDAGVLERDVDEKQVQSIDELNVLVKAATDLAKSEEELNPDFYDADLEAELGGDLSAEDDWANPDLDGLDDYGNKVYEEIYDKIEEEGSDILVETSKRKGNLIRLRLADGTVIMAEVFPETI